MSAFNVLATVLLLGLVAPTLLLGLAIGGGLVAVCHGLDVALRPLGGRGVLGRD
jgi:hypothetical protein